MQLLQCSESNGQVILEVWFGGDPLSAEFMNWLSPLRFVERTLGKSVPSSRVRGATCFETSQHQLREVLIGLFRPKPGGACRR